jgi:hypothetical protein
MIDVTSYGFAIVGRAPQAEAPKLKNASKSEVIKAFATCGFHGSVANVATTGESAEAYCRNDKMVVGIQPSDIDGDKSGVVIHASRVIDNEILDEDFFRLYVDLNLFDLPMNSKAFVNTLADAIRAINKDYAVTQSPLMLGRVTLRPDNDEVGWHATLGVYNLSLTQTYIWGNLAVNLGIEYNSATIFRGSETLDHNFISESGVKSKLVSHGFLHRLQSNGSTKSDFRDEVDHVFAIITGDDE